MSPAKKRVAKKTGKGAGPAPPPKPKKKPGRKPITFKQYEIMTVAWYREQTIAAMARDAKVSHTTAKRYLERGDPNRGMTSIRARWESLQAEAQDQVDSAQIRTNNKVAKLAEGVLDTVAPIIMTHGKKAAAEWEKYKETGEAPENPTALSHATRAIDKMGRLLRLINGEPDQRIEHTNPMDGMTDEEAEEFVRTGVRPMKR